MALVPNHQGRCRVIDHEPFYHLCWDCLLVRRRKHGGLRKLWEPVLRWRERVIVNWSPTSIKLKGGMLAFPIILCIVNLTKISKRVEQLF